MVEHPEIISRRTELPGGAMHSLQAGSGPPVVLLHGNPTSSELWRGVMGDLATSCRCIAPDLIGMGRSSKPPIDYTFADHAAFLDAFFDALDLQAITLVAHDWGVALALDVMARQPVRVRGIAFMEGRVRPLQDWSAFDAAGRALFQRFRLEPDGTQLIVNENMLIDIILQAGTLRRLSDAEMDSYRSPYIEPAARRPLLQWTREIPVGGAPATTAARMGNGYAALRSSLVPKLALVASPGAVIDQAEIALWRGEVANLSVVDIGEGTHFLPLDRPREIAAALHVWMRENGLDQDA